MITLSPSILAADFSILGHQLHKLERAGVRYLHIDVMDGIFVPSISFGMPVIKSIRKAAGKGMIFDVHLMIIDPERYIAEFAACGADLITFHLEASDTPQTMIEMIHSLGMRSGITVRPDTPIELLFPYLAEVGMVLIMSVNPGFGGQEFIAPSLERIRLVRRHIDTHRLDVAIQVDGGIYHENVDAVLDAGADVIVAGSAVFGGDIAENVRRFAEIFARHETDGNPA